MEDEILYQDSLIEIKENSIILKKYYFPFMSSKKVLFITIEKIETKHPSLLSGKWRIHGTRDFRTWYPLDSFRSKRDKIFFITYKSKLMKSGFTVEDSDKVENIFIQKDLIK